MAQVFLGVHADLECARCHNTEPDGTAVTVFVTPVEQEVLCGGCHDEGVAPEHANSHPSGFVPTRTLPAGFPLDPQGRFTCSTCHNLHQDTPVLLRGEGAWVCEQCHPR